MSTRMDYDTPMAMAMPPVAENKRPYLYALLKQIAPLVQLPEIAHYFKNGFSESEEIKLDGTQDEYDFFLDLYRNQIIHPQNVDFIAQFAHYTENQEIIAIIHQYYQYIGGKSKLLITAKFTTTTDKPPIFSEIVSQPPQGIQQYFPASIPPNQNIHSPAPNVTTSNTTMPHQHIEPKPSPGPVKHHGIAIYPLQRDTPRGICVIINNEIFTPTVSQLKNRRGSSTDKALLIKTFLNLRYDVRPYDNLESGRMIDILTDISQLDHSSYDSFVCCMLTHGYEDNVFASDSKEVHLRAIYDIFQARSCCTLGGKPKIFIIQACRGYDTDPGTKGLTDGDQDIDLPEIGMPPLSFTDLPTNSDFLIAYGTVYGYVSWRHPEQGTWFINILCRCLDEQHDKQSLMNILTIVNSDLSEKKTSKGLKQIAAPVNQLRGLFYFDPPPGVQLHFMSS